MIFNSLPCEYPHSRDFTVTCDGIPLHVAACRVSKEPINQIWPGYQRPIYQTEPASFVSLCSNDGVTLKIIPSRPFENVTVRPLSKNVLPEVSGGEITVRLPTVGQYVLELDGRHTTLAIFIDPVREYKDGDIVFGAGIHKMTEPLVLESGQTVVIEHGAVVYGSITAKEKENISVVGGGILDNSTFERGEGTPIHFERCSNVHIEGITVVDASEWSVHCSGCRNVEIESIKLIGMWRYNSDGVDFTNCTNASLRSSFLRNYDDCAVIKGLLNNRELDVNNILVEGCVIWCDWGRALEIGAETSAPSFSKIVFRDCDIIHGASFMLDIQHGDRADISDILFEDIRVEYSTQELAPMMQTETEKVYVNSDEAYMPSLINVHTTRTWYTVDDSNGDISNVTFRNISVTTPDGRIPRSQIFAGVEGTSVSGITLESIFINGVKINSLDGMNMHIGDGVSDLEIR